MVAGETLLELMPGVGVNIFKLGDSLWHVLDVLRAHRARYSQIRISWDHSCPATSAITLHLPFVHLHFPAVPNSSTAGSPLLQLLHTIEIVDISSDRLALTCRGISLTGLGRPKLARKDVGKLFGPTIESHPSNARHRLGSGGMSTVSSVHDTTLLYPGISFVLEGKEKTASSGRADDSPRRHTVDRISVFPLRVIAGGSTATAGSARVEDFDELDITHELLRACRVKPKEGIELDFFAAQSTITIRLNSTTSQDLLLDLGPPIRKYYEEDDCLSRARPSFTRQGCWWNYFNLGLDFLVEDGSVTKIMVHSNIPGTALFQRHARCPWSIQPDGITANDDLDATVSYLADRTTVSTGEEDQSSDDQNVKISAMSINGNGTEPVTMTFDRTVGAGYEQVQGIGPSRFVVLDGIVLEGSAEGAITSVMLCC